MSNSLPSFLCMLFRENARTLFICSLANACTENQNYDVKAVLKVKEKLLSCLVLSLKAASIDLCMREREEAFIRMDFWLGPYGSILPSATDTMKSQSPGVRRKRAMAARHTCRLQRPSAVAFSFEERHRLPGVSFLCRVLRPKDPRAQTLASDCC